MDDDDYGVIWGLAGFVLFLFAYYYFVVWIEYRHDVKISMDFLTGVYTLIISALILTGIVYTISMVGGAPDKRGDTNSFFSLRSVIAFLVLFFLLQALIHWVASSDMVMNDLIGKGTKRLSQGGGGDIAWGAIVLVTLNLVQAVVAVLTFIGGLVYVFETKKNKKGNRN